MSHHLNHKDIVWLDLLLKVLAGLIVVFGIYKLVRSKFWLTAKSEPDFQKTMAPWIGEAWNELSYRQMLEQAVAENDFKLAIRIRYGGLLYGQLEPVFDEFRDKLKK